MEIKEEKFFEMAAVVMSGTIANPANSYLVNDSYSQSQAFQSVLQGLRQAMASAGIQIKDQSS